MAAACVFCRIVAREIPATIVREDGDTLAFNDLNPQAPLHVLVIPKRHLPSVLAADDEALLGRLTAAATAVARDAGREDSGFRLVINTGAEGGQTVEHLHVHVLAGRRLGWPPG